MNKIKIKLDNLQKTQLLTGLILLYIGLSFHSHHINLSIQETTNGLMKCLTFISQDKDYFKLYGTKDYLLSYISFNEYTVETGPLGGDYPWVADKTLVEPYRDTTFVAYINDQKVSDMKFDFDYID